MYKIRCKTSLSLPVFVFFSLLSYKRWLVEKTVTAFDTSEHTPVGCMGIFLDLSSQGPVSVEFSESPNLQTLALKQLGTGWAQGARVQANTMKQSVSRQLHADRLPS